MAMISNSRPAPFGAVTIYRITSPIVGVFSQLSAWNKARQTQDQLSKLSTHQLADIGLERGDIQTVSEALSFK